MHVRNHFALLATGILVSFVVACLLLLVGCSSVGDAASVPSASTRSRSGVVTPDAARPASGFTGLSAQDGFIPDGGTVRLTDDVPAVTKLDGSLREALTRAGDTAKAERGVEITLTTGWRSAHYQRYLFDQAVTKYGSEQEASRWVKPVGQSQHERGKAVDVATADAMDWLSRFGAQYGLCQIYANEAWHFELAASSSGACPTMLTDSAG
jgi:D-alanyl-D-alanine carboxypeptidase